MIDQTASKFKIATEENDKLTLIKLSRMRGEIWRVIIKFSEYKFELERVIFKSVDFLTVFFHNAEN